MKTKPYTYDGEKVTVTFDLARCIHAAECVRGLPEVFDSNRKPWVQPSNGDADELLRVVERCPTGALRAVRKDGGEAEPAPVGNTATVEPNGPIYVRGDIRLMVGDVELRETRVALCRCGASNNKPLCDGSHTDAVFNDPGALGRFDAPKPAGAGPLHMKTAKNGPMLTTGSLDIYGAGEAEPIRCARSALCRCGASANKPFCDGSHKAAGFEAG